MVKKYCVPLAKRLGQNIAVRRIQTRLTQGWLAERLAIEPVTLSRYESGKTLPSLVTLEAIANALGTTMSSLLGERERPRCADVILLDVWLAPLSEIDRQWIIEVVEKLVRHCDRAADSVKTAEIDPLVTEDDPNPPFAQ